MSQNILVIKLGALGDFIQAGGAFSAIRAHHNRAAITLLTSMPFADFSAKSPWFNEVWVDKRPKIIDVVSWFGFRARLCDGGFQRVYDLQTSDRSNLYFRLFWPNKAPEWSGIARGCSHPHSNSNRNSMHTIDRQAEQLVMAGLAHPPNPDFSWVNGDISRFQIRNPYALLVPGGAAHRPAKRWPINYFKKLASLLERKGIQPIVIGTLAESEIGDRITDDLEEGYNLAGQTSLEELFVLSRRATYAIGNDNGPMHLFSAQGCPSVVLYSAASDPTLCAQRGSKVTILRRQDLATLYVEDVARVLWNTQSA